MATAVQTQTTRTMTPEQQAMLEVLIQQLMNGGTQEQQRQSAARQGEVNAVQAQRAQFSPEAAFANAQGLMTQVMADTLRQLTPTITRAAEGAGASGSSMRALLANDAAAQAAQRAAAEGGQLSAQYGQIGASLSNILESLTRTDNSQLDSLLNAFQLLQNAQKTTDTETAGGGGGGSSGGSRNTGSPAPSTADFFNRPGGILSNSRDQRVVSGGPFMTDGQVYDRIRSGLNPIQEVTNLPGADSLFTDRFKF
ncbi:MAG: hypothetical protein AB7F19_07420 [Candidatus Babeliales bacterium]